MNQKITITVELANSILKYLSTKPFAEVYTLIQEMQKQGSNQSSQSSEEDTSIYEYNQTNVN